MSRAVADAPAGPLAVTVPEAARLLSLGLTRTWELVSAGEIECIRLGEDGRRGRVIIPVSALQAFIARRLAEQAARSPGKAKAG